MSLNQDSYHNEENSFIHPEMPTSNWRRAHIAVCWLVYSAALAVLGYYVHGRFAVNVRPESVAQNYRLSDAHYIYKKQPLPLPEDSTEEMSTDEGDIEQQPATEEPAEDIDLKARVKQAMAELDQQ
ncbi:hypothetical protein [unidentified bacterial endosymbiont]|uniref:hypothetical protein n=1 Tax=unidentified bacterial endosymbiont TaxID=2355 RepID=UPI00209C903D|nr:hypothetical protein [unidentified bacterial endosymbiont]